MEKEVLGGTDQELPEELEEINSDNEWVQAIQRFLKTGVLSGGAPAVKQYKEQPKVKHVSVKQRRAIGIKEI